MKSFTERNPKRLGAIVVVVALVAASAALLLHRSMFLSGYTVAARFPTGAGIAPGDTVTVAGVDAGSVTAVHLRGNAVVVDMTVNHGVVLPRHTAAAIEVETVLGVLDVALQPVSGWSHPLRSGAMITDTSVPVEFQNLQDTSGKLLEQSDVTAFNQVLTAVDDIAKGKATQVASIISGLDRFTGVVDARSSQVSDLIDAADTLSATVASRDRQLSSVVTSLDQVVAGLASRSSDLAALIRQTDQLATQTASLVGQNQPQIQQLLDHLHAVLGVVATHQEDLAQAVAYLDSGITGFAAIGYSGVNDTPNQWGNIYVTLLGSSGVNSILGSCGVVDQALNRILGPDPLPCSEQAGPPVTSTNPGTSSRTGTSSGTAAASGQGAGTGSGTGGSPASSSGTVTSPEVGPLGDLVSPLLGSES